MWLIKILYVFVNFNVIFGKYNRQKYLFSLILIVPSVIVKGFHLVLKEI